MKIKAVLIDLDGTLINSIPLILQSDNTAIKKFGFSVSHQQLRELSQLHSRDIGYYLMDTSKCSFNLFDFIEYRRKVFLTLLKKHKPRGLWFKDSKKFIVETTKALPMGVITGSRHKFVDAVFDKKTRKQLSFIVTSDDVEHKKPDIEPLLLGIKKMKLKPKDVIFIGDSIQDALMCQRAGVAFIAKVTGISTEHELRKYNPVYVAKDFAEIQRFLTLVE